MTPHTAAPEEFANSRPADRAKTYWAFISYTHADRDWANWLHRALERYRIPRRLVGTVTTVGRVPERLTPVFLDRAELAASTDLDAQLQAALNASRSLIVICSPAAAIARRVIQEIELFMTSNPGRLLTLIVDGRPDAGERGGSADEECFPAPLRIAQTTTPLAADIRPGRGGRQEALLKLVAGILNLNLDQLRQRDLQRKRRVWRSAAAAGLIGMACTSALAFYAWNQRGAAIASRDAAVQAQSRLLTQAASQRLKDHDVAGAQGIILEVLSNPAFHFGRAPGAVSVFQESRAADREVAILSGHRDNVWSVAYSPDGSQLVTASEDGTARVWDARTGIELARLAGHTDKLYSAAFSPDGTRIVTGSRDKTARIWDANSHVLLKTLSGHSAGVASANFSPDGSTIVTTSSDKTARIWNATSGAEMTTLQGHQGRVLSAAFSPDGSRIVTGSQDQTARVWDWRQKVELAKLIGHSDIVISVAFSHDGRRIVTGSWDGTVRIWDAFNGTPLGTFLDSRGHQLLVLSVAFSPDDSRLAIGLSDNSARLVDAQTGKEEAQLAGHSGFVNSARYSPDGQYLATASKDQTVRIWDVRSGSQLTTLAAHDEGVCSAVYSPDGSTILTGSWDKTARLWNATTATERAILSGHTNMVYSASFSSDGTRLVTASEDNTARIWDFRTAAALVELTGHTYKVNGATFSPDDRYVVTAANDNKVRIWDSSSGMLLRTLVGHRDFVLSATYAPDGQRLVTASRDKTVRIWDANSGTQLAVLNGHTDMVRSARYSPDGKRIVSASEDATVRIWNAQTGALLGVLLGSEGPAQSARFSPDGAHIVSAADTTARIWDAESGVQLAVLAGHSDNVLDAAYSPDGTHIVTASADKTARIWDAMVPAVLDAQLTWEIAAHSEILSDVESESLGMPSHEHGRTWPRAANSCDRSAGAFYDPDRRSSGVVQRNIDTEIAIAACRENNTDSAAMTYQKGRALLAGNHPDEAKGLFEDAVAHGYRAAQIDLGNLLQIHPGDASHRSAAVKLYEAAWKSGVPIAAFALGQYYENDRPLSAGPANPTVASQPATAWMWYQKGVDVGEPHSLARFAEREEKTALNERDGIKRRAALLRAFAFYAIAAEDAKNEDWPDDAWIHWRYRRATLARVLAREGMMQQVADAYRNAIKAP